jgi:hypothetical protein
MRTTPWALLVATLCLTSAAAAQQRDSTTKRKPPADSAQRADSAAAADSAFFANQLKGDSAAAPAAAAPQQGGPTNPRLLPDFSAVGDFVGDFSPKGSTQEDGSRFGVREVEIAVQAAVDPYFRGDVFIGLNDVEKVAIEQAYLTTTALPYGVEARIGRYLMPFGKQNTTHRHDLHTVEYPWVLQRFFGAEGLKGTGLYGSRIFSPFGFYQEVIVTAVDRYGEAPDGLVTEQPLNRNLSGLAYLARLRNYWDLSQAANVELSASAITGDVAQPAAFLDGREPLDASGAPVNAVAARQSVVGLDFTYRYRPLRTGLYESFMLQAEGMRQLNGAVSRPADFVYGGPSRDYTGGYVFARYQLTQRGVLGARYDRLQDPLADGRTFQAASALLEFFPSEFSRLVAAYERVQQPGVGPQRTTGVNRVLLQAVFSLGPHRPHPF